MGLVSAHRRSIFTGVWMLAAAIICWLQVTTLQQRFRDDQALAYLSASERHATLAAIDRLGIGTTAMAGFWLVSSIVLLAVYLVLGWLLVRRGQPAGFSIWLALVTLSMTSLIYPPDIPDYFPNQPVHEAVVKAATMIGVSGFFTLPLLFPTGRFVPRWTIALGAYILLEMALFAWTGEGTPGGPPWLEAILTTIFFGVIAGSAIYRYRWVSNADQRRQSRWVLFGFLIGIPCFLIGDAMMRNVDDSPRGAFFLIGFPLLVLVGFNAPFIAVASAVLYHRLFDIDVVLGRTMVWLAMTALVVGTYIAIVLGLGTLFDTRDNLVLAIVATGLVAVAFQPVHARVQRAVNRFVFGDRDDPYAVISRVGHQLAGASGLADLLPQLVRLTAESLRLPYVALYLDRTQGLELAAAVGSPTGTSQRFPLAWQGQPVGALDVAPRGPGEPFNAADRRLLEDLASQIGLAAHAVTLAQDLQASRERIVTSREEERRRLRRDLHDGLGAQLAALMMQTGIARSQVRIDPARAEAELDLLRDELKVALAEIRELVQGLRPPALDELGLAGALRSRLERLGRGPSEHPLALTVEIAEPLPPLTAATEVAVYRIVEEAVTNVLRHARASTLQVVIRHDPSALEVTVRDDGAGIPADHSSGVGWQSMRERTSELGGSIVVGPGPDGQGTSVQARFPLEVTS